MNSRSGLSLLVVPALFFAPGCSHSRANSHAAAAAAPAAEKVDFSLLGDTDVRLLAEALAYDVTHAGWLASYAATSTQTPALLVGAVPQQVPPSDVPFPKDAFTGHLVQSLRNAHRVDVVATADGVASPVWRLDVAVDHDDATVEGEQSRGYRVTATLLLQPSNTSAWSKQYALRKRVRTENSSAHEASH